MVRPGQSGVSPKLGRSARRAAQRAARRAAQRAARRTKAARRTRARPLRRPPRGPPRRPPRRGRVLRAEGGRAAAERRAGNLPWPPLLGAGWLRPTTRRTVSVRLAPWTHHTHSRSLSATRTRTHTCVPSGMREDFGRHVTPKSTFYHTGTLTCCSIREHSTVQDSAKCAAHTRHANAGA